METMRRVVVAWIALHAATAGADPPTVDDAIAHAAAAKRPLILEFGAAWCKPCRELDTILARPDIQKLFIGVDFVRYDVDASPGDVAAARYQIGGLPTFLLLGIDCEELVRHTRYPYRVVAPWAGN